MSYYDDVCEYSYSQSYEHFGDSCGSAPSAKATSGSSASAGAGAGSGASADGSSDSGSKTYKFCSREAGNNILCGTVTNLGGFDKDFSRESAIACPDRAGGHKGAYVCNTLIKPQGESMVYCGCLWEYNPSADENVIPSGYSTGKIKF